MPTISTTVMANPDASGSEKGAPETPEQQILKLHAAGNTPEQIQAATGHPATLINDTITASGVTATAKVTVLTREQRNSVRYKRAQRQADAQIALSLACDVALVTAVSDDVDHEPLPVEDAAQARALAAAGLSALNIQAAKGYPLNQILGAQDQDVRTEMEAALDRDRRKLRNTMNPGPARRAARIVFPLARGPVRTVATLALIGLAIFGGWQLVAWAWPKFQPISRESQAEAVYEDNVKNVALPKVASNVATLRKAVEQLVTDESCLRGNDAACGGAIDVQLRLNSDEDPSGTGQSVRARFGEIQRSDPEQPGRWKTQVDELERELVLAGKLVGKDSLASVQTRIDAVDATVSGLMTHGSEFQKRLALVSGLLADTKKVIVFGKPAETPGAAPSTSSPSTVSVTERQKAEDEEETKRRAEGLALAERKRKEAENKGREDAKRIYDSWPEKFRFVFVGRNPKTGTPDPSFGWNPERVEAVLCDEHTCYMAWVACMWSGIQGNWVGKDGKPIQEPGYLFAYNDDANVQLWQDMKVMLKYGRHYFTGTQMYTDSPSQLLAWGIKKFRESFEDPNGIEKTVRGLVSQAARADASASRNPTSGY